jgi:hypothetical protein
MSFFGTLNALFRQLTDKPRWPFHKSSRPPRRLPRRQGQTCRLLVELLEDRTLLSGVAPTPISPSGTISADIPTFNWTAVTDANHYALVVVDTTTQQVPLVNSNIMGTLWTPAKTQALTPGHSFIWAVGAVSSGGATTYSVGLNFNIAALPAPTPMGPTGNIPATSGFDMPVLRWSTVAEADHYAAFVIDTTTNTVPVFNSNVAGTQWAPSTPLTPGHSYVWYVGAVSTNGLAITYDIASAQSFTLAALAAPTATGPSGTIPISSGYDMPTFGWNSVVAADHYYLYVVDTTANAAVISTAVNGLSFTASTPLPHGHSFTWYIGAISTNGLASTFNFANPLSFTIATLAAPTAQDPTGSIGSTAPVFTWSTVPIADFYAVLVIDATSNSVAFLNPHVAGTFLAAPSALTAGDYYVWLVRALGNNGDASPWSNVGVFTVPLNPTLTTDAFDFAGTYPTPAIVGYTDKTGTSAQVLAFPGQVEVWGADGASETTIHNLIQAHGGGVVAQVPFLESYVAAVTPGTEASFIAAMQASPSIDFAVPHGPVDVALGPTSSATNGAPSAAVTSSAPVSSDVSMVIVDKFNTKAGWTCGFPPHDLFHGKEMEFLSEAGTTGIVNPVEVVIDPIDPIKGIRPVVDLPWRDLAGKLEGLSGRIVVNVSLEKNGLVSEAQYKTAERDFFMGLAKFLNGQGVGVPGSIFSRTVFVVAAGNGLGDNLDHGVPLALDIAEVHRDYPLVFSPNGPHMFIVGGTQPDTGLNSSSIPGDMVYAQARGVPIDADGCTASGTSNSAAIVSNLFARAFVANPNVNVATITKAFATTALNNSDIVPTDGQLQVAITGHLATPTPVVPSGTISYVTPYLVWTKVFGATSYEVLLDDITTNTLQNFPSITPNYLQVFPALFPGDNYAWLVRAVATGVAPSGWSTVMQFTIKTVFTGGFGGFVQNTDSDAGDPSGAFRDPNYGGPGTVTAQRDSAGNFTLFMDATVNQSFEMDGESFSIGHFSITILPHTDETMPRGELIYPFSLWMNDHCKMQATGYFDGNMFKGNWILKQTLSNDLSDFGSGTFTFYLT